MTAPPGSRQPSAPPGGGANPPPRDGSSVALTGVLLLALGAGAVFWAGMTLGGSTSGRNAEERAAIEAFAQTYRDIADRFIGTPVPAEVLAGALDGMMDVLDDPYSDYMPPAEYDAALDEALGEFEGVGAIMETADDGGEPCDVIGQRCRLRVVSVLPGAPAEAAGLESGDSVIGVDGEALDGRTIDDTIRLIRGPRDSEVVLTVERGHAELEIPITRDTVVTDDVRSATVADGRVGYIAIDSFSGNAAEDFAKDLQAHLDAGLDKLVVDVRDDPGGFVDATVEISSQFIDEGAVFWEEYADGEQVAVEVSGDGIATDPALEVVLLVNGGSASASEILAGALQDAGRARLVGEPTFGKGTVQEWAELPGENGGYRLSIAKWLTRDKTWIDGDGLTPDVAVELEGQRFVAEAEDADPGLDSQVRTAVELLLDEPLATALPGPGPSAEASPEPAG
jgi:carboxyl-terminal processing protease